MPPYNQVPGSASAKSKTPLGLFIAFAAVILMLVATICFAIWAYGQMKDYKNNSDKKSATAVAQASTTLKKQLEDQFSEQNKSPVKTYNGPAQYGSIKISYPKTWSAYVVENTDSSGTPVDGYFYPDFVPDISGSNTNFYLRVQILGNSYKSALDQYAAQVTKGTLRSTPFVPEQVKGATTGVRLDGQLSQTKKGSMVILPLRDKVLKIWVENDSAAADFNNFVLKNLTFSP